MDDTTQNSDNLCSSKVCQAYSLKSCTFFLLIFFLLVVCFVTLAASVVIFIVKAQKPGFSVETLRVVSFDLDTPSASNSSLFASSVVSLTLTAQNPNKFGIKFGPTRLHVYIGELPVGVIRVPGFNQPAHSNNVSVVARVLIHCLNVNEILSGDLSEDSSKKNSAQIRLAGVIGVSLNLFHLTMPRIKVFLECHSVFDNRQLTFINEMHTKRSAQIHNASSLPINSKSLFNKCDIAVYI